MFEFICNICGSSCTIGSSAQLDREKSDCGICGSTVRFRWIVHALSCELFGKSIPLTQFPGKKTISGVGMSEWTNISKPLEKLYRFQNTFYHSEPK
ncbi:MAG: hypothetical protein M3Y72_07855, partial [Acidobacteriota bacterium]|nr:hypothetical protein [Acidobacteriota bacterium]